MKTNGQQAAAGINEIVNTRDFTSARDKVWSAFSDPARLAQWWGPRGFTNAFHEFDFRPTGLWRFTMHGPDGARYEQTRDFLEVVQQRKIVLANDDPVQRFRMTIAFEPHAQGTRLTWSMVFESAPEFARVKDLITAANEENFNWLEAHLSGQS
jgi:uncharacterized protein YndB with AHSA1/START domain